MSALSRTCRNYLFVPLCALFVLAGALRSPAGEPYRLPGGLFPTGLSKPDRDIVEKIELSINTDSARFTEKLIKAIGRNEMVGRILIGFYKQEIAGGPVLNVNDELRHLKDFFHQKNRSFFFWDNRQQAVYLAISPDEKRPECQHAALTFWQATRISQQEERLICEK